MIQRIGNNTFAPQSIKHAHNKPAQSFDSVLQKATSGLKVSAHAKERIQSRSIPFGATEMTRMEKAVKKAEAKGCRESIVMLDRNAFVVSVRNKTIITAMDGINVKENVFTNIDSAVIA